MTGLETFMATHGYGALLLLGFAEFAAFPVATIPILMAAGALAGTGTLSLPGVILSVGVGGLLADVIWLLVSRRFGSRIVHLACGMSVTPDACVLQVERNVSRLGEAYLVFGKFLPGVAPMLAAGAGMAGMRLRRFLLVDGMALLLWATAYATLGWIFAGEIAVVLAWIMDRVTLVLLVAAGLWGLALAARVRKVRSHRRIHGDPDLPDPVSDRGWREGAEALS